MHLIKLPEPAVFVIDLFVPSQHSLYGCLSLVAHVIGLSQKQRLSSDGPTCNFAGFESLWLHGTVGVF